MQLPANNDGAYHGGFFMPCVKLTMQPLADKAAASKLPRNSVTAQGGGQEVSLHREHTWRATGGCTHAEPSAALVLCALEGQ